MRTLILLSFMISFSTLICQKWQTAEWVNMAGEQVSGKVKIPTRKWQDQSSIQLISNVQSGHWTFITPNDLVLLYTHERDTLLQRLPFGGQNYQLQTLIKGKISLLREVSVANNFFIIHKDSLINLSRYGDDEQLPRLLNGACMRFARRAYSYNTGGLMRIIRALNKCSNKEEPKWLSSKWGMYKWKYAVGVFVSNPYDYGPTDGLILEKNRKHLQLGVERNFVASIPHLSALLQASFYASTIEDIYTKSNVVYNRKIERSYLKFSTGLHFELLPRRAISPFTSAGVTLSMPMKSHWTFSVSNDIPNTGFNGLPSYEELEAEILADIGLFYNFGLRFNLSDKTKLSLTLRSEIYPPVINTRRPFDSKGVLFHGVGYGQKRTPYEDVMLGIILTRSFSMGL